MAYIFVRALPNHIPVTVGTPVHYGQIEFLIYKSDLPPREKDRFTQFQEICDEDGQEPKYDSSGEDVKEIKKGPRIVISAKTALPGSIFSEDALCLSSDIPSVGYSFTAPDGWSCSQTYESSTKQVSFIFAAPTTAGGSSFTGASIKLNSFFTKAQAGVCTLEVRVENFSKYVQDVKDSTFSIPLSKRYYLEILNFTANGLRGNFYLNHGLPSLFEWDAVCDLDTPLELLVDGTFYSALQEFTGEKIIETRDKGDHTYTLKMSLPEGEKTESIKIKDTRWRSIGSTEGITPDFTAQNSLLSWKNNVLVFHAGKVYEAILDKNYELSKWTVLTSYDGEVQYSNAAASVIYHDELHLIGGTKSGSDRLFYSVFDLKAETEKWTDYNTGQFSMLADGAAAASSRSPWMVYAKQTGDSILFLEYVPEKHRYVGVYTTEITGLKSFAIGMRGVVLYLAVFTGEEIILKTWQQGESQFREAGKIVESPVWMQWINGNSEQFLLTNEGLYQENGWKNIEDFQPPYPAETFSWVGNSSGRIISLISQGEKSELYEGWATDVLC